MYFIKSSVDIVLQEHFDMIVHLLFDISAAASRDDANGSKRDRAYSEETKYELAQSTEGGWAKPGRQ